ncbi:hypothetical protein [Shewanella pealeana]|uniref:hypothetical protein n=1 Tax=Shewanella pealeana TaxID=70864 RepID=UPI00059D821E|nr:hypothetical protein [Shewanella pealeana]
MKAIIISLFLLCISFNIQASGSVEGVTKYSEASMKELKIDSLSALIVNHFNSNNLNIKNINTIKYLENGFETEMTQKEKDKNLLSAEVVEVLINDKALIINAISHKAPNK